MNDAPRTSQNSILMSFVSTGLRLFGHAIVLFILCTVLVVAVPRHIEVFDHYDLAVPTITIEVINISTLTVDYWYLFALVALLFDGVVMLALSRLPAKARWLVTAWSGGVYMAAVLLMGLSAIAISLPLERMPIPPQNEQHPTDPGAERVVWAEPRPHLRIR